VILAEAIRLAAEIGVADATLLLIEPRGSGPGGTPNTSPRSIAT
jgi:hypothetical protein